jgi:3',5'-cyclic AMP phosphodiesterase CpdA
MSVIAHLSDLHFGRHDPLLAEALVAALRAARPDVVAISGDITQRARRREFAAARAFLDVLDPPAVVVPGNHDVPLYDVGRRFLRPLGRFRRYVSAETEPWFCDDEVAILGLNTARSSTFSNGRISHRQIGTLAARFARAPAAAVKVLVIHHPLTAPPDAPELRAVGRAATALEALAAAGIGVVLAGHHHRVLSGDAGVHHPIAGRGVLTIQAGTAISTRRRQDPNSFNLVRIEHSRVACIPQCWGGTGFVPADAAVYERTPEGWRRADAADRPDDRTIAPPRR